MNRRCFCCGKVLAEHETQYHLRCMKRVFHSTQVPVLQYTQDQLNELAKSIIMERISVPGVQVKLSLHLERGDANTASRLTLVGLEGDYILKPQTSQWAHLPEAEHFCMLLARECRIATADFTLIPLQSGELAYLTRRMDRTENGMLHMEDFCQILNKMTAQKYSGSMEQIGKALRNYSDIGGLDAIRLLELTIFCFLTGNSDMHLKNFSLLRLPSGQYELSPAYDLVPVKLILPADQEELALTLNGKKNRLKRIDFECYGKTLGLTQVQTQNALKRIVRAVQKNLPDALKRSFLSESMQNAMQTLTTERIACIQAE